MSRLTERVCRALNDEKEVRECSFVYLPGIEGGNEIAQALGVEYFAAQVEFAASKARSLYRNKRCKGER